MVGRANRPGLAGYPVNLLVRGRRVVVVGGGRIAARKIEPLLEAGARVEVVSPEVGAEIRAWQAAFAALSTAGRYEARVELYRAIPEWIVGMAVMHAHLS